jgi:hypothetical protein
LPLISNVGHHGKFVAHSLRSALKAMHSPFSASFHSGKSTKYLARLPLALAWFRVSFAGSFFTLRTLGFSRSLRLQRLQYAPRRFESVRGWHFAPQCCAWQSVHWFSASRRSSSEFNLRALQAKVEAFSRHFLSEVAVAESSFFSSSSTVPCSRAMPNLSINRTANGGPHLHASATTVPPLSAGYLKR